MKTLEKIYTRQLSTYVSEEQYQRWLTLCKQENKSSYTLLRELVLFTVKKPE